MKKNTYQRNLSQTHHRQTHHQASLFFDDSKYRKSKIKRRDKNKKCRKCTKQDLLESSSREYDLSNESDYKSKRCNNNKSYRKNHPNELCANLTEKLLMTAYTPKIINLKLDGDPLQGRICFIKFIESLEVILYQYKETCEVLLDYKKIGGGDIKYFVIKAIRNIMYSNIDFHIRRLIYEY